MLRPLLLALTTAAAVTPQCGSSSSTTPGATPIQNFQPIVVNAGPANNYFNGAFTTVTICVPGQTTCQTIDGVLVDTGSSGLRLLASTVTLALPQQTDGTGSPIAECAQFLDGFTWGPVETADVRLGGAAASVTVRGNCQRLRRPGWPGYLNGNAAPVWEPGRRWTCAVESILPS